MKYFFNSILPFPLFIPHFPQTNFPFLSQSSIYSPFNIQFSHIKLSTFIIFFILFLDTFQIFSINFPHHLPCKFNFCTQKTSFFHQFWNLFPTTFPSFSPIKNNPSYSRKVFFVNFFDWFFLQKNSKIQTFFNHFVNDSKFKNFLIFHN